MSINTPETDPLESADFAEDELSELIAGDLIQKIVRSRDHEHEQIVGLFRCEFEPQQLRHALNIPIHPPMKQVPEIDAVVIDGQARIRVTNKEKFGVRLEIIVDRASTTKTDVCVEVIMSSGT